MVFSKRFNARLMRKRRKDFTDRREFIKVGIAGTALFAAVRFIGRPLAAPATAFRALDERAARIVAALVPVVLAGSLPPEGDARAAAVRDVVASFDRSVAALAPAIQSEVGDLFGVLSFPPSRLAFTGLWAAVEESSAAEIKAFLDRWRTSRFDLQRVSYHALTQFIQAAWYDDPRSWPAIGYPGPPAVSR
jgi:hypothetical protein